MVSTGIPIYSVFVFCMTMAALSLAPMVISGNLCSSYFCRCFLISCIKIGVTRDSRLTFPVVGIVPVNTYSGDKTASRSRSDHIYRPN